MPTYKTGRGGGLGEEETGGLGFFVLQFLLIFFLNALTKRKEKECKQHICKWLQPCVAH